MLGRSFYFYTKDLGVPVKFMPPGRAVEHITRIPCYRQFPYEHAGLKCLVDRIWRLGRVPGSGRWYLFRAIGLNPMALVGRLRHPLPLLRQPEHHQSISRRAHCQHHPYRPRLHLGTCRATSFQRTLQLHSRRNTETVDHDLLAG